MSHFWSRLVHELTPYTPGEQPKLDNLVKLNTNENPYGPSPEVIAAIDAANTAELRKYPDPSAAELKRCIAHYYQLNTDNVFVGNSSDEVLAHVFRGLLKQSRPLLFPDITYSFYPVYCSLYEIDYREIPLREDFTLCLDDYDEQNGGIIFANPNAPTGLAVLPDQIAHLLERNVDSVVVVDEAYVDFSEVSVAHLIKDYPNLVVTQTLSKSRSLAGLRVGLALGDAALIEALERIKNSFHPYALDRLALAGAVAAFEDEAYFRDTCNRVVETREQTIHTLRGKGFEVLPSKANFVFASHPAHDAADLFKGLRQHGVVVRYFDKPRLGDFLRISIGTPEQMNRLFDVLDQLMA